MNSKKNLVIGGIIIIVLVAGAFLWKGGFLGQRVGTALNMVGISNKMTDEIYIKIMTDIAKISINSPGQAQDVISNEKDKILNKYGISDSEFITYSQALFEDRVRSAEMSAKLQQIMTELLKTGGK